MSKDSAKVTVKIIKPRISKFCICPFCNTKQLFRKKKEHWKTVKEINIDGPVLLKIQIVYAKYLNPNCERASFPLPIKRISKYQKATARLIKQTIASNILDNVPAEKIKGGFVLLTLLVPDPLLTARNIKKPIAKLQGSYKEAKTFKSNLS